MRAPISRLRKDEIIWLSNHRCKQHSHDYLSHYSCYLAEQPNKLRVGYLDLECSHLQADIGILLTWCIKKEGGEILEGSITARDISTAKTGQEDKRVVAECVEALKEFDIVVTYYGSRFDIPFLRTRAVTLGIDFPHFGAVKHIDAYDIVKHRFCLLSKRLVNACRALLGKTDKTLIDWATWRAAARGDKTALNYVLVHNRADVRDLEKLYLRVKPFSRRQDKSI